MMRHGALPSAGVLPLQAARRWAASQAGGPAATGAAKGRAPLAAAAAASRPRTTAFSSPSAAALSAASASIATASLLAQGASRPRARADGRRGAGAVARAATGAAPTVEVNAYLKAKVEEMAALQPVMVFSKSWCPFCTKAKQALEESGVRFAVLELDTLGEQVEGQIQDVLASITGARTVPRVFVGGECIGGGTDTQNLAASGELKPLAEKAIEKYTADLQGEGEFKFDQADSDWQSKLDPEAFRVLRRRGTEPPGSHPYDKMLPEKGHFGCGGCGLPLYSASSKFASSCGWPVFNKVYESPDMGQHVTGRPDGTGSLEIICTRCGSHLGHVFYDAVSESNPNGERH